MFVGILIIATITGYVSGAIALAMGSGVLMSLAVVAATGTTVVVCLALLVALRSATRARTPEPAPDCPATLS